MIRELLNRLLGRTNVGPKISDLPNLSEVPNTWNPEPIPSALPEPEPEDVRDWVRGHIAQQVAAGFESEQQIIAGVLEIFEGDLPQKDLESLAKDQTPKAINRLREEQTDWPDVTDNDLLEKAISSLLEKGIVFRENFSCCGTCGASEIWDEMDAERAKGRDVRGYAFYHKQDTESAVDGEGLYLDYGATEEGEAAALDVAGEIQRELEAHGLSTHWNGSWGQRLGFDIDWKRRYPVAP